MRKLLILSILLVTIASCKKSDPTPSVTATITADIDGVPTTFNTDAIAVQVNASGIFSIGITGYQGAALTSNQITIGIGGTAPVAVGVYNDLALGAPDEVSFAYTQQPDSGVYAANAGNADTATVIVTSISSTEIQGTFSGAVVLTSGSTSPSSHIITNGKFTVKFSTAGNTNNNNTSTGTITAKVDGVSTTFNTDATAIETSGGSGGYTIDFGGYQAGAGSSNNLTLSLSSNAPFTSGTVFSDTSSLGNYPEIVYAQQPGTVEYTDLTVQQTIVTLTSISSTNIQGTFSGTAALISGSGSPASHVFTNGTFNLPLTH